MSFFGPGTLSGATPDTGGLDPQLLQALVKQFPALQSMGSQEQPPNTLQSMGYGWQGPTLFQGQGTGSFSNLSPFESAGGASPESITGGLAMGTFGKSSSQSPLGSTLSLPNLQIPQAQVAASQGGYGGESSLGGGAPAVEPSGGFTLSAGDVAGGIETVGNLLSPPGQTIGPQTPGMQEQRAGERADYTSAPQPMPLSQTLSQYNVMSPPLAAPQSQQPIFGGTEAPTSAETFSLMNGPTDNLAPGGFHPTSFTPTTEVTGAEPSTWGQGAPAEPGMVPAEPGMVQKALEALGLGQYAPQVNAAGSLLGAASGAYSLYSGAQSGNVGQAIGGALQTTQGAVEALKQLPTVAANLGLTSAQLTQMSNLLGQYAPIIGAALAGAGADMSTPQGRAAAGDAVTQAIVTSGAGAAVGLDPTGLGPVVLGVVLAINDALNPLNTNRVDNPIKGAAYSAATSGVASANQALNNIPQGDVAGQGASIADALNNLLPYFSTSQGATRAILPSESAGAPGTQTKAEYAGNEQAVQQRIQQQIQDLLKQGLTYEQIGALPGVDQQWGGNISTGGTPEEYYAANAAKYNPEAYQIINKLRGALTPTEGGGYTYGGGQPIYDQIGNQIGVTPGTPVDITQLTPDALLKAALGSSLSGENEKTNAGGLLTNMYGGAPWAALARMGSLPPDLQAQISQHFDPWATVRNFTQSQLLAAFHIGDGSFTPQAGPAAPPNPAADFWTQQAKQNLPVDPQAQAIQQYMQQLQGLQTNLPQIQAALTAQPQMPTYTPAGSTPAQPSGQGIDLQALLRQMGYLA